MAAYDSIGRFNSVAKRSMKSSGTTPKATRCRRSTNEQGLDARSRIAVKNMSPIITLSIAVTALRRNAMRTALTALGMIIGVAAVIVMVAIGHGAQSSIESQIKSAGTNIITVNAGAGFGPVRGGAGATTTLTVDDA